MEVKNFYSDYSQQLDISQFEDAEEECNDFLTLGDAEDGSQSNLMKIDDPIGEQIYLKENNSQQIKGEKDENDAENNVPPLGAQNRMDLKTIPFEGKTSVRANIQTAEVRSYSLVNIPSDDDNQSIPNVLGEAHEVSWINKLKGVRKTTFSKSEVNRISFEDQQPTSQPKVPEEYEIAENATDDNVEGPLHTSDVWIISKEDIDKMDNDHEVQKLKMKQEALRKT